jgi:hypothetical protein
MKKLLSLALKILPLFTLYKAVTSGSKSMKPLFNLGGVVISQYEIGNITKLVAKDYQDTKGNLITSEQFPQFINESYADQYSVIARQFTGADDSDLSLDIWEVPFQLEHQPAKGDVYIKSSGPDKTWETKDDIQISFQVRPSGGDDSSSSRDLAAQQINNEEYDEEGFDRDGFNRKGLDQDGYDRDGGRAPLSEPQEEEEPQENQEDFQDQERSEEDNFNDEEEIEEGY